jgi:hypothetical protein
MHILKFKLSGPLKLDVAQGLRLEFGPDSATNKQLKEMISCVILILLSGCLTKSKLVY